MSKKWLSFMSHDELRSLVDDLGAKVQYVRVETAIGTLDGIKDPNQASFQDNHVIVSMRDVQELLQRSL